MYSASGISSSKALSTVRPPKPESNTPMVGGRVVMFAGIVFLRALSRGRARSGGWNKFSAPSAACSRRNRRTVRASAWMSEKGAYLVRRFRRKDVFELAGLLLDFRFAVHGQAVSKKALGEAMSTNDAACPLAPAGRKLHDQRAIADRSGHRFERIVAGIDERLVIVRVRRMRCREHQSHLNHFFNRQTHGQRAVHFHALDFRDFAMLGQYPQFFEHLIELLFIGHGKNFLRLDPAM